MPGVGRRRPMERVGGLKLCDDFPRGATGNGERSREGKSVVWLRTQSIARGHPAQFGSPGGGVNNYAHVLDYESSCSVVEERKREANSQPRTRSSIGVSTRLRCRERSGSCVQPPE